MPTLQGRILSPAGWLDGSIRFDERVLEVAPGPVPHGAPFVVPGFVDVHVHGGGGGDTMDGAGGIRTLAAFHARHGTTALLATTITNPWDRVVAALGAVQAVMLEGPGDGARVLGAHLEGPFISPQRLGAQPPFTVPATAERLREVLGFGVVRVVTLAPEEPGGLEAAEAFARAGVRVSLGHTVASAEVAATALAAVAEAGGVAGGTHLFNAMGGLEGRKPGVVGALLADPAAWAELILDGHHVHAASFRAAHHAKPERLVLITDAIRAAGLADGDYDLGGQVARVAGGTATLADGTLAGSVLTMDEAVRNAVKAGLPLATAVNLASLHPAQYLGLSDHGRLEAGSVADAVVLDEALAVREVYVAGRRVGP